MPNTTARILTVSELCKYLHLHKTTIYRLLKEGKLPGFRIGSDWRFSVDAIEQWVRDNMKTASQCIDSPGLLPSLEDRHGFGVADSAPEIPQD